jgi:outer membrane beta-barrel protein
MESEMSNISKFITGKSQICRFWGLVSALPIALAIASFLTLTTLPPEALAQGSATSASEKPANTAPPSEPSSDKIDVGNLEQKYWSAKDDDFTVVQNRTFTKNRKFFVSLMSGKIVNDGFLEGSPNSLSLGYYFNEKNGVSLDYTQFTTKDNQVTTKILDLGSKPAYNSPLSTASVTYMWSPIYAKVSLLERRILYLDMSIGLHLGVSNYRMNTDFGGTKKQTSHYGIDISQLWFLSKNFAIRFDVRNTWANQDQLKYKITTGADESTRKLPRVLLQDNSWLFGINYFFGK